MTTGSGPSSSTGSLPRATVVASVVTIAAVTLATFFGMRWYGSRVATRALEADIAVAKTTTAALSEQLAPLAREQRRLEERSSVLWVGTLKVCNSSDRPVTITQLAAIYPDSEGTFQTFNSEEQGHAQWRLAPGEVRELSDPQSGWDGSVSFYSLWIRDRGEERPFAGTWPAEAGYCVRYPGT
jgi:hypothetical protein